VFTRRSILAAPLALLRAEARNPISFDGSAFRVEGWTGGCVFDVYAGEGRELPAMLGTSVVESGVLTFRPRFPLSPGVRARAVFQAPGRRPVEAVFEIAPRETKPIARVAHVYPSATIVPANLLKVYVHFTAPMRRGEAWDRIRLLDHQAKPVELAFLELDQELWDAETRRLTVLFDPGRIKRGVLPREEVGSGLVEGSSYTLVIDREWRDANGAPLQQGHQKQFRVGPETREPIHLKNWRVSAPRPGTGQTLTVDFPAPLDHALLQRLITVHHGSERVTGAVSLHREETQWRFEPISPWTPGDYRLQVDTALEDLAGNRVGRPFDVDTFDPITVKVSREAESIPFRLQETC
jgi:hypothetical protein